MHFVFDHLNPSIPQKQMLTLRAISVFILIGLSACSTFEANPVIPMMHRIFPQGVAAERTGFAPPYHYLRVAVDDNVIFMASDTQRIDATDTACVWYSAGREVLRFQNGRLVAAVGLATEWRAVVLPVLPSWSVLAAAKEPVRWTRIRDVMPGYRYGVNDSLLLQRIPAPKDSRLKGIDPHALTWFEERFDTQHNDVSTQQTLPLARYAVAFRDAQETVVYGEQCVSAKLCFSWQRWPVRAEEKQ